jgi:3',5'-cyclic AMP phosphodiesterase CpdA
MSFGQALQVVGQKDDDAGPAEGTGQTLYQGGAVTTRESGAPFTFALLTDSHITPRDPLPLGTTVSNDFFGSDESTLLSVAGQVAACDPDFLIHLGDMLDYHPFGFNVPPPDRAWSRLAYLNYRRLLGDALGHAAHFAVIGNWEGEDGFFTPEQIARSSSQRLLYLPGPHPGYPQGGGSNHDYYAFTWGDALFVVLNVMTYTPTSHLLGADPGLADDWTLGAEQRAWLERTLAGASSKWRFLFIHHAVGGAAGDIANSAYGRGGGRAARVGEQSLVHEMMLRYRVQIFFYGHDHVFTDMTVDGIHYTLPGSAGAPWKFERSITGYEKFWPDSGYAKVQVSPERGQVDFVALGGQVLNSYMVE